MQVVIASLLFVSVSKCVLIHRVELAFFFILTHFYLKITQIQIWNVQEQVEEVLKWFITMTCEGLFPNISTFVVVYGYGYLALCLWNGLQLVDRFFYFGVHRFVSSTIVLCMPGLGERTLYVVAVMTFLYN